MKTESLWPELSKKEITPVDILEQQASFLKEKYNGKLMGQVVTTYKENDSVITVSFYLIHTGLRGYNYRLLWFDQNIEHIYKFNVSAFSNPSEDFGQASKLEEFIDIVKIILISPRMKMILNHLLTLGEIVDEDNE
jgi:hypothetical protein